MIKLKAKEIAEYLGLSEKSLRNLLTKKKISLTQGSCRAVLDLIVERRRPPP